jgi:hypothetical protein
MRGVIRESSPTNKGRCPDVGRTKGTCVTEAQDRDPPGIEPRVSPNLCTILPTKLYWNPKGLNKENYAVSYIGSVINGIDCRKSVMYSSFTGMK